LLFEKGVLLFEKGVLLFEKGVLLFEKGVLLFEKGVLLFEKIRVGRSEINFLNIFFMVLAGFFAGQFSVESRHQC
jgi:hypothetical protein